MGKEKLITKADMNKLLANGAKSAASGGTNHKPVVKVFNPFGRQTWLISEITPANPDIAFGLCDVGTGTPELGYLSLRELESVRCRGLPMERDRYFTAEKTLVEYAAEARKEGRITA